MSGYSEIVQNLIQGDDVDPSTTDVKQIGVERTKGNAAVYDGNTFRYLHQAVVEYTEDYFGTTHDISGNTFRDNIEGIALYSDYAFGNNYQNATVSGNIRCNTFESPDGVATAGIWIKNHSGFYDVSTNLSELGSLAYPNGNRFADIDPDRRVVNDNITPPYNTLTYYAYGTTQETVRAIKNTVTPISSTGTIDATSPANPVYACLGSGYGVVR